MEYFETLGNDGRVYLHYDRWQQWRWDRLREYPCAPGKFRFDIELAYPCDRLADVPVKHPGTHGWAGLDPHTCFYECDDWSTIFGVYDAHLHQTGRQSWRMLIESGNADPLWGERVTLFSTSCCIENEPWGQNQPNRFAFFRGKFWQVSWCQFLNEWRPPIRYPLSNFDGFMKAGRPYADQRLPSSTGPLVRLPFREERGMFDWLQLVLARIPVIWTEGTFVVDSVPDRLTHGYDLDWRRYGF